MSLTFGVPGETPLDLSPAKASRQKLLDTVGYYFLAMRDGTELSTAEAVLETFTSQGYDGQAVDVSGWNAGTQPVTIKVKGRDSGAMAAGCAELDRVANRDGLRELTWVAPDGASAPTVWDVLEALPTLQFDDDRSQQNEANYLTTFTTLPWPRSANQITVAGVPPDTASPTTTPIDDGSSLTHWQSPSQKLVQTNLSTNPSVESNLVGRGITLGNTRTTTAQYRTQDGSSTINHTFTASSKAKLTRQSTYAAASGNWYAEATPNPVDYPDAPFNIVVGGTAYVLADSTATHTSTWAGSLYITEMYDLQPNTQYTFSIYIRKPVANRTIAMGRRWDDGTTTDGVTTRSVGDDWSTRLTYTFNSGSHGGVQFYFYTATTASYDANEPWRFDADMLNPGGTAADYSDGNSPGGIWLGAVNNSASVLLAAATPDLASGVHVATWGHAITALRRDATIDLSDEPFIKITGSVSYSPVGAAGTSRRTRLTLIVSDGTTNFSLTPATISFTQNANGAGTFTAYYRATINSAAWIQLNASLVAGSPADTANLTIASIDTTSALPVIGTGRQTMQTIQCYGTMPAEAQLTIDNGLDGSGNMHPLGQHTLVYTRPSDPALASPNLRQYRTVGNTQTAAPGSLSGYTEPLGTSLSATGTFTAAIPVSAVSRASHLLAAMLSATGLTVGNTYTLLWQTFMTDDTTGFDGTNSVPGSGIAGSRNIVATGTTWASQPTSFGELTLPSRVIEATGSYSAYVNIRLAVSGGGTWLLDDAWIFDVVNGQLSVVSTTESFNRLDITPASADNTLQRYLTTATAADGSTLTRNTQAAAKTRHLFNPAASAVQAVDLFAVSNAATPNMAVSAKFYPRWNTFAAAIDPATDTDTDEAA